MDSASSNDLHWDTAYRPPSSTAQHSASFAGSPDLGYPSPVASASYASPHALVTSTDQASMSFAQIPSSVGPSRVLTRRQRAALEQGQTLGRRSAAPSTFPSLNTSEEVHSPARSLFDSPRPQTPDSPQTQRQRLSGSTSLLGPLQMQPPYPPTPDSAAPFSPHGYFDHSRTASSSDNSNARSASPALSTVTSVSSHTSTTPQTFASFPPPMDARKPKQRKQRLFNLDRRAICEFHRDNPSVRQEDIAAKYGVERSTISKILKHKTKWLNVPANEDMRIAKHRPSKFPIIEDKMVLWLADPETQKTQLSDLRLREKAREIAQSLGVNDDRFKASSGWVENFKHRHGIRGGVWTGDGPKSGARKARALGVGTFDTQEDLMHLLPPDYPGVEGIPMHSPVEPTAMRIRWDAPVSEQPSASSTHIQSTDISASSTLDHVHQHNASSEHPPPMSPSHGLDHPHHSPLEQNDHHASLDMEHHEHHHHHHPTPTLDSSHYPPSADGMLPTLYPDGTVVYQPPQDVAASVPTLVEAEDYFNRILLFFDSPGEGEGLLNREERAVLDTIRKTMFNAASGIRP